MTRYYLLFERLDLSFPFKVAVSCAVVGDLTHATGVTRTFANYDDTEAALKDAEIRPIAITDVMSSVRSGSKTFIEVTEEDAYLFAVLIRK